MGMRKKADKRNVRFKRARLLEQINLDIMLLKKLRDRLKIILFHQVATIAE